MTLLPADITRLLSVAAPVVTSTLTRRAAQGLAHAILTRGLSVIDDALCEGRAQVTCPHPDVGPTDWTFTCMGRTARGPELEDAVTAWAQAVAAEGEGK